MSCCASVPRSHRSSVGRDGDKRQVPVTVVADPDALTGPVDWVLVTTKGHQTAGAFPWLQRLARPETPVVVVQNGVDHARRLAPAGLPGPVLPALAWIWARREEPGRVAHAGGHRLIVPAVPVGRAFATLLAHGPIDVELSADFVTDAWRKLLTNVAASPVTALTGRTMEVLHSPGIGSLVRGCWPRRWRQRRGRPPVGRGRGRDAGLVQPGRHPRHLHAGRPGPAAPPSTTPSPAPSSAPGTATASMSPSTVPSSPCSPPPVRPREPQI